MLPKVSAYRGLVGGYFSDRIVINKRLMAGREHMVRNEIAVLKRVSVGHRNILTLVDYFETMNNCKSGAPPCVAGPDISQYTL